MDLQDTRMQCLRMAAELSGKVDAVIAAAQRMFDFVKGAEPAEPAAAVDAPAADNSPELIAVAEPQAEAATAQAGAIAEAVTSEPLVADPIAACGTALVMPESGNLAEALPSLEAGLLLRFRSKSRLRRGLLRLRLKRLPPRQRLRRPRPRLSLRRCTPRLRLRWLRPKWSPRRFTPKSRLRRPRRWLKWLRPRLSPRRFTPRLWLRRLRPRLSPRRFTPKSRLRRFRPKLSPRRFTPRLRLRRSGRGCRRGGSRRGCG